MDNIQISSFISSPDTELERIIHACKVAASGFYSQHGFVVTPQPLPSYPEACVVIPRLDFGGSGDYWEQLATIPLVFPMRVPSSVRSLLLPQLSVMPAITKEQLAQYRREWERVSPLWWEEIGKILPEEVKVVGEIEVRLTRWGTVSSYSFLTKKRAQKLIVYLRSDVSLSHLAEAIVSGMLYPFRNDLGVSWSRREAIVDFILTRASVREIFPDYRPTLTRLSRISKNVRIKSELYCQKLGMPRAANGLAELADKLTKNEYKLVQLLESRSGMIVSFDEIADLMWGEGEFRTFWAINKLVQRIRAKMKAHGMDASRVVTKRGRGYTWS